MTLLAVGATGMLAPAVRQLLDDGTRVVAVARRPERLEPHPLLRPVAGDWAAPELLAHAVHEVEEGPFAAALLWVHSTARPAVYAALAPMLADDATVVEVNGSAADPDAVGVAGRLLEGGTRTVRRVRLGQVGDGAGARWLTHDEISAGALRALVGGPGDQVVGRLP